VTVAGLVLAAGEGRRFGGPKALVVLDGDRLVDRAVRVLRLGGCAPVVVVLGAAVVDVPGADAVVLNEAWREGLGSSLRAGLTSAALGGAQVDAAVVLLVDTPDVQSEAVHRVRAARAAGAGLAVATYRGERGHPVLIGREHWTGAADLAVGEVGARAYLAEHPDAVVEVPCDDAGDPRDVDSTDELAGRSGFMTRLAGGAGSAGAALGAAMEQANVFYGQGGSWQEEKRAEALRREDDEEGAPPFDVDLEAGVARIRRPR